MPNQKVLRQLDKARREPLLHFTAFSIPDMFDTIRQSVFPEIRVPIGFCFTTCRHSLGCILDNEDWATIFLHQILNRSQTPREVFGVILKHELLHLRIPPRAIDGKEKQHPPEFWDAEKAICPERDAAWHWIWENLMFYLHPKPKAERIEVLPGWRHLWCDKRPKELALDDWQKLADVHGLARGSPQARRRLRPGGEKGSVGI